jgi:hypothetical protein
MDQNWVKWTSVMADLACCFERIVEESYPWIKHKPDTACVTWIDFCQRWNELKNEMIIRFLIGKSLLHFVPY